MKMEGRGDKRKKCPINARQGKETSINTAAWDKWHKFKEHNMRRKKAIQPTRPHTEPITRLLRGYIMETRSFVCMPGLGRSTKPLRVPSKLWVLRSQRSSVPSVISTIFLPGFENRKIRDQLSSVKAGGISSCSHLWASRSRCCRRVQAAAQFKQAVNSLTHYWPAGERASCLLLN